MGEWEKPKGRERVLVVGLLVVGDVGLLNPLSIAPSPTTHPSCSVRRPATPPVSRLQNFLDPVQFVEELFGLPLVVERSGVNSIVRPFAPIERPGR